LPKLWFEQQFQFETKEKDWTQRELLEEVHALKAQRFCLGDGCSKELKLHRQLLSPSQSLKHLRRSQFFQEFLRSKDLEVF
jgi:hypothetical protein